MPGTPPAWERAKKQEPEPDAIKPPGTTHISIADARQYDFDDQQCGRFIRIPHDGGDGIILNNQLTDFSFVPEAEGKLVANRVEGGSGRVGHPWRR